MWFWALCGVVLLHMVLLLVAGLHSSAIIAIQLLRPLVTTGAIAFLVLPIRRERGPQRWSRICLAIGMACTALFSTLKICFDASIAMPGMRLLWFFIQFFYVLGAALYVRQRLLRPGNAFLVFHGSIVVDISTLIILHSLLPLVMPAWPWSVQVTAQLPSVSFDIGSLFIFAFLRVRFGRNVSFFLLMAYHACLIVADATLTAIVWGNWTEFAGVAAPTYPLYALQSVLFGFAVYRDSSYQGPALVHSERIVWEEAFILAVVPALVISALFAADISGNVPHWLLVALFVCGLLYVVLVLLDHWRTTKNIYLTSLVTLKSALPPSTKRPPED